MEGFAKKIILMCKKESFIFEKEDLEKLLFLCSINYKKDIISAMNKHPKYMKDILILFSKGLIRKIFKKSPAIKEISIINRIKNISSDVKFSGLEVVMNNNEKIGFVLNKFHLCNLMGDGNGIFFKNQYSINPNSIKNKVVLDCGAHHGTFSILCAVLGAKKIYAFEPMKDTYKILSQNIKKNNLSKKIIPINKAVGSSESREKIFFSQTADGSASLNNVSDKFEIINVLKLDNFVRKKKIGEVGLIKMDVEGNEEQALLGAKNIITKYKPILTLSAYHKPTDKEILPKIITSIRQNYKIKLINNFEEDFYCN